jgi:hypothetical protein
MHYWNLTTFCHYSVIFWVCGTSVYTSIYHYILLTMRYHESNVPVVIVDYCNVRAQVSAQPLRWKCFESVLASFFRVLRSGSKCITKGSWRWSPSQVS